MATLLDDDIVDNLENGYPVLLTSNQNGHILWEPTEVDGELIHGCVDWLVKQGGEVGCRINRCNNEVDIDIDISSSLRNDLMIAALAT